MKIEYTKEEAQGLLQIIDLAVKANGLQIAQAAAFLAEKIARAIQDEEKENNAIRNDNK